ncbi:MAG: hypothetical protein U0168_28035 [Nannocystaceae bacterium]
MTPTLLGLAVVAALGWIGVVVLRRLGALRRDALAAQSRARALLERPGGTPAAAIAVASPAQIEPRAARQPCPHCDHGGGVHVVAHVARVVDDGAAGPVRLREVQTRCSACGRTASTWFLLPGHN